MAILDAVLLVADVGRWPLPKVHKKGKLVGEHGWLWHSMLGIGWSTSVSESQPVAEPG